MALNLFENSARDRVAASVIAIVALGGIVCALVFGNADSVSGMASKPQKIEGKVAERYDDMALGDPNAPIQIVEYASFTCPHCAAVENEVFPKIKEKYIDTGKVRFIYRDYPLDAYATAASMAARCRGKEHYFDTMSLIFQMQAWWAQGATDETDLMNRLTAVMKETGMSKETFDACVRDDKLLTEVQEIAAEGDKKFDIHSTPTFIINGQKVEGELSFERFETILAPLLPKAEPARGEKSAP